MNVFNYILVRDASLVFGEDAVTIGSARIGSNLHALKPLNVTEGSQTSNLVPNYKKTKVEWDP